MNNTKIGVLFRSMQHLRRGLLCLTTTSHQPPVLNHGYDARVPFVSCQATDGSLSIQVAVGRCHHRYSAHNLKCCKD